MRRIAIPLLLVVAVAACSDDPEVDTGAGDATTTSTTVAAAPSGERPDRAADIVGTITSVEPFVPITEDCTPAEDLDPDGVSSSEDPPICTPEDSTIVGTVVVEEQPGLQEGRKVSFTVDEATVLGTPFADLAEGDEVDAWTTGMCAESYPEQCTAEAIAPRA